MKNYRLYAYGLIFALLITSSYSDGALSEAPNNMDATAIKNDTRNYNIYNHSFDGAFPVAALIQAQDGNFYGTTENGGINDNGTIFRITASGQESIIYRFTRGSDGSHPRASLIQAQDGNFYGTTEDGGINDNGTIFRLTVNGQESIIYRFTRGSDGSHPRASLIQAQDGNFYGTTTCGGINDTGTVFRLTASSGQESVIYSFTGDSDGINPGASLIQAQDGNFYGTTEEGGINDNGIIFRLTASGQESVIYRFTGRPDGSDSKASLIQAQDGNFYGTTVKGGYYNYGTVFSVTKSGQESVIYSFAPWSDGVYPYAGLIQAQDGNFYGTTNTGVDDDYGIVFRVTKSGQESVIYSFTEGSDGAFPNASLIQAQDGNFYSTTFNGGISNNGTVFRITKSGQESVIYSFTGNSN